MTTTRAAALLLAVLALGCESPGPSAPMPDRDPSIEIRASARTVGTAIADGMTSSGYHTRRREPYVLEFESGGALVHYSLSERTDATYVLAKVTPPEGFDAQNQSFRRYQLANEVQRFLEGVRSMLEGAAATKAPASQPEPASSPTTQPSAPPERPGKLRKRLGL